MAQITLTESKKEELAQKYIDYICKRHGLDQESREAQLIYYAYMHGMNNCLDELKRKENVVMTQYIDKDSLIKESEDEKIREEIIDFLQETIDNAGESPNIWTMNNAKKWIAWLEKQGEHAKFRNSIQVGDKVTRNEDGVLVNLTHLKRVANKGIEKAINEKKGEQKQTVIIPRFRVGDVITSTKNSALKYKIKAVGVLNELGEYDYVVEDVTDTDYKGRIYEMSISKVDEWGVVVEQKPAWSEDDKAVLDALILRLEGDNVYVSPKLAAECLKSLKDRVQPQPKQEWSEEDEKMFRTIISDGIRGAELDKAQIDWFKSLKDRVQPQPKQEWSEEDRSKVQRICKYLNEGKKYYADIIEVRECIEWLKALNPHNT